MGAVSGQEDIKKFPSCKSYGMGREKFAHSRMFIEYDDGTTKGTCGMHCAVIDLIQLENTVSPAKKYCPYPIYLP
jgi:hypothetical protein